MCERRICHAGCVLYLSRDSFRVRAAKGWIFTVRERSEDQASWFDIVVSWREDKIM